MIVVCNGSRKCKADHCYHHKHHHDDVGCNGQCQNDKIGIPGSTCIEVIKI